MRLYAMLTGRPDPPKNCLPVNVTSTRFTIQCEPGYGGGLPQHFACTVATIDRPDVPEASYVGQTGHVAVKITGLRPSTRYVTTVYASNAKGTSIGHVRVYVETAPNPKDPHVAGQWIYIFKFSNIKLLSRISKTKKKNHPNGIYSPFP